MHVMCLCACVVFFMTRLSDCCFLSASVLLILLLFWSCYVMLCHVISGTSVLHTPTCMLTIRVRAWINCEIACTRLKPIPLTGAPLSLPPPSFISLLRFNSTYTTHSLSLSTMCVIFRPHEFLKCSSCFVVCDCCQAHCAHCLEPEGPGGHGSPTVPHVLPVLW